MKKLLGHLRDPIWQAIGVVIAIIALFFTTSSGKDNTELAIYHYHSIKFEDYRLPADQIRLTLVDSNEEISKAVVDYFVITNKSKKPLVASDFSVPISLSAGPKTEKIYFATSSCGKSGEDGIYQPNTATSVALNWLKDGIYWKAQPTLINPAEYACVTVISKVQDSSAKLETPNERFLWNARIISVPLKVYSSEEAYSKTLQKSWTETLKTSVTLTGFAAYWFVIFQIAAFYLTTTLAMQASIVSSPSQSGILWITLIVLLCTGTAEILTDIFINLNLFNLHFLVWLFLAMHAIFILFLFLRARVLKRSTNKNSLVVSYTSDHRASKEE